MKFMILLGLPAHEYRRVMINGTQYSFLCLLLYIVNGVDVEALALVIV